MHHCVRPVISVLPMDDTHLKAALKNWGSFMNADMCAVISDRPAEQPASKDYLAAKRREEKTNENCCQNRR